MKDIAVIILTYNSGKTIERCLKSVLHQECSPHTYDVMVVDNGSTDDTIEIIKSHNVKYCVDPALNISGLRNLGARVADSRYVGYVDSDCVIDRCWIRNGLSLFQEDDIAIVGYKYLLPSDPSWLERNWYKIKRHRTSFGDIIPAGNMIIRKSHFDRLGGFNENLVTGEDSDLLARARKNRWKTVSSPDVKSVHLGNAKNLRNLYYRELWYGMGVDKSDALKCIDKPFYLSNLLLVSICVVFLSALQGNGMLLLFSSLFIVSILLLSALDRKYNKNIDGNLLNIMTIYSVYYFARIHSLVYIYGVCDPKKYKRIKNDQLSVIL